MATSAIQPTETLKNLQAAYNGESNARAKYLAFAKKADDEGYHRLAALFQAAARAEQIHAEAHARVIRSLGAEPVAEIGTPHVGTIEENLKAAIAGETHERDVMYPAFIAEAKASKQAAAVRTFEYALAAEAEHAKLYAQALQNLAEWTRKGAFYVCPTCGYTTEETVEGKCPVCSVPGEKFEKWSCHGLCTK